MMDSIVNRKHAGSKGRPQFGLVTVTRRRRNQQQKQQQLKTSTVPRCYYPVSFTMFLLPLLQLMILLILATMVQGAIAPTKVATTGPATTTTTNDCTRTAPAHEPVSITNATTTTGAGTGGVLRVPTTETEKSNTVVTTLGRSLQKQGHEFDANERTRTRQRRKRRGLAFLPFYSDWK